MTFAPLARPSAYTLADIPAGHTPVAGTIRWTGSVFEIFNGSLWSAVGGSDPYFRLNISGADLGYANPATPGSYVPSATPPAGLPGVRLDTLDFPDGASISQAGWIVRRVNKLISNPLALHLTWFSTATAGSVVWQAAIAPFDSDSLGSGLVFGSLHGLVDAAPGTAYQFTTNALDITAGLPALYDDFVLLVRRDPTNGNDDMAGTARLVSAYLV
jgi:hypothetical protein